MDPLSASRSQPEVRDAKRTFHIAIAEDNPGDVSLIREALQEAGLRLQLTVCQDGEKMAKFLARIARGEISPPDIFLLDLNLPRVDGIALLKQIRAASAMVDVPVVIVTSSDSPKDRQAAQESGATAYFRKPSDYDEFMHLGTLAGNLLPKP